MLSKCIKYPQIADYKRCIQELDTKQFVSLRFMLSEIRNHHCLGFENSLHNNFHFLPKNLFVEPIVQYACWFDQQKYRKDKEASIFKPRAYVLMENGSFIEKIMRQKTTWFPLFKSSNFFLCVPSWRLPEEYKIGLNAKIPKKSFFINKI